jgi:multidrug efflux pump subunit AcrA (membrane-fusion protein)
VKQIDPHPSPLPPGEGDAFSLLSGAPSPALRERVGVRAVAAILLFALAGCSRAPDATDAHTIATGPLAVWTVYPGKLEARRVETIMSKFNGSATIVELAPEGMPVSAGDLLVKFDSSQVERDLLKLQRDAQLARSDLERLERAELPLELRDL